MSGIFDGLESLGFKELQEVDLLDKNNHKDTNDQAEEESPMSYLTPKVFTCPVCGLDFTDYLVKKSKLQVVETDTDLRTTYHVIDPNYYDVILCIHCGYAALQSQFDHITEKQANAVMEKVMPSFKSKNYPVPLSAQHAVERYKIALLCAVTKEAKSGEKAFLCLKTAWLYRDMGDEENELLFLSNAYKLFINAIDTGALPVGPFDEITVHVLVAELARRIGNYEEAARWIGAVTRHRKVGAATKKRAETIMELIKEASSETSETKA